MDQTAALMTQRDRVKSLREPKLTVTRGGFLNLQDFAVFFKKVFFNKDEPAAPFFKECLSVDSNRVDNVKRKMARTCEVMIDEILD